MRVLITGGGGFLGAWITRRLRHGGHEVRILDRSDNRTVVCNIAGVEPRGLDWRVGDVASTEDVVSAAADCDSAIHLAALLTPACRENPVRGAQVNLIGTLNVFEAARRSGMRAVAYASSAGVFGPDDGVHPRPTTHYGAFKLACEGCARAYWADEGIASIGLRPFIVYGPGRELGLTAGPTLACRAAARGEPYAIPFTGDTDMIFVDDVAGAFVAAATRPPAGAHALNLLGTRVRVEGIIEAIRQVVPAADLRAEGPTLPITADIEPDDVAAVLGGSPVTPLADGIAATVEYYRRDHRPIR